MRHRFVQDAQVEGTLQVVTVRSQRASAALVGLDFPELSQDVVVVRAADIPGTPHLAWGERRMPLLAAARVSYVGEPVALVAARELETAQAVASEVIVRYGDASEVPAASAPETAALRFARTVGSPPAELSGPEADRRELVTLPRRFAPPSPQEAVAFWDGAILVVRTATQDPFHVRDTVCDALGLPKARVRVVGESLEGPGGKLLNPSLVSAHAALVAFLAKSPARVRYSWREELGVAFRIPGTRASWQTVSPGAADALAARFRLTIEGGAYDPMARVQLERAGRSLGGLYRYSGLDLEVTYEGAETVPCELPPGCGDLEGTFVRELCVSAAARASGVDPAQWRIDNLETRAPPARHGRARVHSSGGLAEALREVVRLSGFSRKHAAWESVRERREARPDALMPMRGIGIALAVFAPGFGSEAERGAKIRVSMAKDRSVTVATSIVDSGRGWHRLFVELVSSELDVPASQVAVTAIDTSIVPSSGPTAASRTAPIIVPLLRKCCTSLKSRLARRGPPCTVECAARAELDPDALESCAATVAGVEVDPATGSLRSTAIWSVIDAGEILDPPGARAVALASLVRGLGVATLEAAEAAVVPVPPVSGPFAVLPPVYRIAGIRDIGSLEVSFLAHGHERGKAEPRGISELALLGVAPAMAAAVAQATGRPIVRLPILPEDLAPASGAPS